jgi:hypothetical protein
MSRILPPQQRCVAFNVDGERCNRTKAKGEAVCWVHLRVDPADIAKMRQRADELADDEHDESIDNATVVAGQSAWTRLKRDGARLNDHRLVGEAMLIGRKICMQRVGATKPRGIKYVTANSAWLKEHGFDEITRTTRQCMMLVAEHWVEIQGWLKTLTAARRTEINNPVAAWRGYKTRDRKPESNGRDRGWRHRQMTDIARAAAAIEAVQREAPELPADVARSVAFAVMRALGVAVPRELLSRPMAVAVELHAVG